MRLNKTLLTLLLLFIATNVYGAVDLDGADDRIDTANLFDTASQAQTISMWVNPDVIEGNQYFICSHISDDSNLGMLLVENKDVVRDLGIRFIHLYDTANLARSSVVGVQTVGTWNHILVTWDGSTTKENVHIYVDGSEVTYTTDDTDQDGLGTATASTGSWAIGGRIFSDTRNFNGKFTEIYVFDRVITAVEIALLANSRLKGVGEDWANCQFYLAVDEHPVGTNLAGLNFTDLSGSGKNGTGDDDDTSGSQIIGETILSYQPSILSSQ